MILGVIGRHSKIVEVANFNCLRTHLQWKINKNNLGAFLNKLLNSTCSKSMSTQRYLERIKYNKGSIKPNLETLETLSRLHKVAIPYTNVEFVNGTRKNLNVETIYRKIVVDRCGGVCHEINILFTWLLRELGYEVLIYSGQFYIDKTNGWSDWDGHSFPFVNLGEIGTYFVDPGDQVTGPMKFEILKPHAEVHGVYRFRRIPGTDKDYYLERHRKTIFNAEGKLLKQGPAPSGHFDGRPTFGDEYDEDESKVWKILNTFRAEPVSDISPLQTSMDKRQLNRELTARNLLLFRYYENGYHTVCGRQYTHKLCPNPVTEIITKKFDITSDEEISQVTAEHFAYEVKDKLTIFERNSLD